MPEAATIQMIGVGGMGMAPLALYLRQQGRRVLGCDDQMRPEVARLLAHAGVELGAAHLMPEAELVVRSTAVAPSHPLVAEAQDKGVPVLRRGEVLAKLAEHKRLIAIAGSHGKTTTTALLVWLLEQTRFTFSYLVGGLFQKNALPPARFTDESDWLVAEIDESDGTIEAFSPDISVILNTGWDHPDRYESQADYEAVFARLKERTRGRVFDFSAEPGVVNVKAARSVTEALGVEVPHGAEAVFPGVGRRQEVLFSGDRLAVYEDYAHHPQELRFLFDYVAQRHPGWRQVVVFQPHRYTRTRRLKADFAHTLERAGAVTLLDVYPASEAPMEGGTSADLQACFEDPSRVALVSPEELLAQGELTGEEPVALLFAGAGDVGAVGREWVRRWLGDPTADWWTQLAEAVSEASVRREHEPFGKKTTLGVGGQARYYFEPANEEDLVIALRLTQEAGVPVFFLGRGSNLIVTEEGFPGLVIRLHGSYWREIQALDDGRLRVRAGARLKQVCAEAARSGMGGMEFLEGIPGTVGGALRMNAGAMGGWMFDLVDRVRYVDRYGVIQEQPREAFAAGYRFCRELLEAVAVEAVLHAPETCEGARIRQTLEDYARQRKASQPREPSAGCIFKNPDGDYAGRLIDTLGLKGTRVGNAEVSGVHGNFIINRGGATSADVLGLIRKVREEVRARSGFNLEPEVLLVGRKWEEVL